MPSGKRELPFKVLPANQAGESLLEAQWDIVVGKGMFWVTVAILCIAVAISQWTQHILDTPPTPWFATFAAAVAVVVAARKWRWVKRRTFDLRAGIWGERYVGAVLEELRAHGYQVVHDVPDQHGNIDHVLIGPSGVYTVETKTRTKRAGNRNVRVVYDGRGVFVDGREPDRDPITQAQAQARSLHQILKERTDDSVTVRPTVIFAGWYVEVKVRNPAVWVHNETYLLKRLPDQPRVLSPEVINIYANAVRRHVRDTLGEINLE